MSDQLDTEATTVITHNKHKRQTSMPSAAFRPTILAIKWPQTYALDCMTAGISCMDCSQESRSAFNEMENNNFYCSIKFATTVHVMAMETFKIIRAHFEKCVLSSFIFKNHSNWNTHFIPLIK